MKKFIRSMPGKVTLFIATILSLCIMAAGILGAVLMANFGFYTQPKEEIKKNLMLNALHNEAYQIVMNATHYNGEGIYERSADGTNLVYELYDEYGELISRSYGEEPSSAGADWWDYHFYVEMISETYYDEFGSEYETGFYINRITQSEIEPIFVDSPEYEVEVIQLDSKIYDLCIVLKPGLPETDIFSFIDGLVDFGYNMRQSVYALIAASALLAIICFIALMCASARRSDTDEPVPGILHKVPFDLMLVILGTAAVIAVYLIDIWWYSDVIVVILVGVYILALACLVLGMCMSLAARIKTGTLFTNTVIWYCCRLFVRICRWLGRKLREFGGKCNSMLHAVPMIWRTLLIASAVAIFEFIVIIGCHWEVDVLLLFWFAEKAILFPIILYGAFTMRTLQKGGIALASGDLGYQIDTSKMFWDFKRHGENLNSIADGMTHAVDQRMRSERMRTELITNVSHDIKTPLTSIINYADLIGKETCENPRIMEYSSVLVRQSDRLKRLIDDLVEASKASTGNLEVLLAPCDAEIFISQISGEYEQKLTDAGLTLVTRQPEEPVRVLADGRRMLRIFDNLMNNICKYAQRGTRVYLTLEQKGNEAVITFRNISRMALDVSEEELMERFVRGDASRNTEGSGLGLSIARSLTELQKGRMELSIDGDLFKVILHFPLLSAQSKQGIAEEKKLEDDYSHIPVKVIKKRPSIKSILSKFKR